MNWVTTLLKNRLAVYCFAIALCLLGIFSLSYISIAPFPPLKMNGLRVHLAYPGANAYTTEVQVTNKVERALLGVDNISTVSADTASGSATINLKLNSMDPDEVLKTRVAILQAIAASDLPPSVPQPDIEQDAGISGLVTYVFTSDKLSLFQMGNYISSRLLPTFKALPGVSIDTSPQDSSILIQLRPDKLAQYHLNIQDINQLLNRCFSASPMGQLYIQDQAYMLGFNANITSLMHFNHIVVGYKKDKSGDTGSPIYLSNIAHITFAPRTVLPNFYSSYNGHPSQVVSLFTTSQANPFEAYARTQVFIDKLAPRFPADMKATLFNNQAQTMHHSLEEVINTILIATILVLIIAFIFLGRWRTMLIPIFAIPICLLGAIAMITALGLSLNILTLLALVVAVGLVVDDAIVVVENITRYMEHGMAKREAILKGTSDIAGTVLGITATLLAVYLPIMFCQGIFTTLLKAFAIPLAAAVFLSGIVALTVTPVLCLLLMSNSKENRYQNWFNTKLNRSINCYQAILVKILRHPFSALLAIILLIVSGIYLCLGIPRGFFPNDPNGFIDITINASAQDSITTLKQKTKLFAPLYQDARVESYSVQIDRDANNSRLRAQIFIQYKDKYLHQLPKFTDLDNQFVKQHHIKNTTVFMGKFSRMGGSSDIDVALYGNSSIKATNKKARQLTAILKKSPMFSHVDNSINEPVKQIAFSINAPLAAKYGLLESDIKQQLTSYYGGYQLSNFFSIDGLSVPIIVQLGSQSLRNPNALQTLQIYSALKQHYYSLSKFVSMHLIAKPSIISTTEGTPSVHLTANLAKGYSLSNAMPFVSHVLATDAPDFLVQYHGAAEQYLEGSSETLIITILGLLAIYFFMAILFNSPIDPIIILLTVPFSIIGGGLSLYLFGDTINLYSTLALITLIGLITKHGVLIVQFANKALVQGSNVRQAILAATHDRFRPIIMTTLAMTLGALPLLLSQEVMYIARRDLGMVLISGLIIGTLFSLFVVPLVYSLVKRANLVAGHSHRQHTDK